MNWIDFVWIGVLSISLALAIYISLTRAIKSIDERRKREENHKD